VTTEPVPLPRTRRRGLIIGGLAAIALLALCLCGSTGAVLYVNNVGPFKDSGLATCESMRDSRADGEFVDLGDADDGTARFTEREYREFRSRFAGSRYDDLREAGTAFADIVWQVSGTGKPGDWLGALLLTGGRLIQAYSDLSGACEEHGVTIPRLTDR
jgi:hypothetical protein